MVKMKMIEYIIFLNFQKIKFLSKIFLLAARKHSKIDGHSEYFIGTDEKSSKDLTDANSIAKLKCMTITGSEYIFYNQNNQQSVAIIYVSSYG